MEGKAMGEKGGEEEEWEMGIRGRFRFQACPTFTSHSINNLNSIYATIQNKNKKKFSAFFGRKENASSRPLTHARGSKERREGAGDEEMLQEKGTG